MTNPASAVFFILYIGYLYPMLNKKHLLWGAFASILMVAGILLVNSKEETFVTIILGMLMFFTSMSILITQAFRK
jgi:hypothetical protein